MPWQGDERRQPGSSSGAARQRLGQPVQPGTAGDRPGPAAIIVTRSPPRSSSEASASSSSPARSRFSTGAPRERQCIDAEASRHRQTVCAASHSVSRMNQPSARRPDFADCRQSMRATGRPARSGGTARSCRPGRPGAGHARPARPSPPPVRRRPAAAAGARRAPRPRRASAAACVGAARQVARPAGRSRRPAPRLGAGGEVQRHAVAQHRTRQRHHVVDAGRQPAVEQRPRPRSPASAPAPRAARAPRRHAAAPSRHRRVSGPAAAHQAKDARPPPSRRPARRRISACAARSSSRVIAGSGGASADAGGGEQHGPLGLQRPDSRRRSPAGSGRAAPRAADRCPPARSGSASPARGTAAAARARRPATATRCSCIACSSADWVRGLARLISSAISSWQNTGPGMKRKAAAALRLAPAPRCR